MRRKLEAVARSLSTRLLIPLLLTVVAVLTIHAVVSFRSNHDRYTQMVEDGAERCSSLILGATHDGMLANRKDQVQRTIERLGKGPGVAAIRVYATTGSITMSASQKEVGRRVAEGDTVCTACHAQAGRPPTTTIVAPARMLGGRPGPTPAVLHHLSVIENEAACASSGCHASPVEQPVLGVLHVEMSLARLEEMLLDGRRQMIWTVASLMLITVALTTGVVSRLIHRPVSRLQEGTKRIAHGDLDTRIDVSGSHELTQLAEAFNRMAADLKSARREITEWSERLEEKVVEKTGELRRAQRQVLQMEKMACLGKLSATVAHELNNPIAGILTYAKLVDRELQRLAVDPTVKDELSEYLRLMAHECSRCGDIVKNLLLFARQRGSTEMETVDIGKLLDRSLMLVRHHLQISDIELNRQELEDDPMIEADAGQLEQALVALCVNAVEAMSGPSHDGGELTVRVDGNEKSLHIDIGDTGVGIHPDVLPRIFEPFFSTKHEESGVGLGLAVVYGIVQRHGGSIEVDSEPGRGTSFHVTLPRHQDHSATDHDGPEPCSVTP